MSALLLKHLKEISHASKQLREEIEPLKGEAKRLEKEAAKLEEGAVKFEAEVNRLRRDASKLREEVRKRKTTEMGRAQAKAEVRDSVRKEAVRILHEIENLVTSKALDQESSIADHQFEILGTPGHNEEFRAQVLEQLKEDLQKFEFKKADAKLCFPGLFPTRESKIAVSLDWSNYETPSEARGADNMITESIFCHEERPMACLNPCGHLTTGTPVFSVAPSKTPDKKEPSDRNVDSEEGPNRGSNTNLTHGAGWRDESLKKEEKSNRIISGPFIARSLAKSRTERPGALPEGAPRDPGPCQKAPPEARGLAKRRTQRPGALVEGDPRGPGHDRPWHTQTGGAHSWSRSVQKTKSLMNDDLMVIRKCKGIINKLTFENLGELFHQLTQVGISNDYHIGALLKEVFKQATTLHHFIEMYTTLCKRLDIWCKESNIQADFRRILIAQCQASFESNLEPPADLLNANVKDGVTIEAEVEFKTATLGSVKLLGRLLVTQLIASRILLQAAAQLLEIKSDVTLECLCALLMATGKEFDNSSWKFHESYMALMHRARVLLDETPNLSGRIKFLLTEVFDCQKRGWTTREEYAAMQAMN